MRDLFAEFRRRFPAVALAAALCLPACDGSNNPEITSPVPEADPPPQELVSLAEEVSEANGGRAVLIRVTTAEEKIWEVAAGLADVADNRSAETGAIVEYGSISKVFLAATVLRLVEQGILGLDDPLTQWFDLADLNALTGGNGGELVLRHLLQHATGMGDYLNYADDNTVIEYYGTTGDTQYAPEEHIQRTIDLTREPVPGGQSFPRFTLQDYEGQAYASYDDVPGSYYSNTGYIMLGLIVQAVTGERYEDMIRQEILTPLALEDIGFGTDPLEADLTGYALGLPATGEDPVSISPTLTWSAGQTVGTLADLTSFLRALYEGRVFDEQATNDAWKTDYFKLLNGTVSYGLGIIRFDVFGESVGTYFGHDGQTFGAVALAAYREATGDVYAIAINNSQYLEANGDRSSVWSLAPRLNSIVDANRN